MFADEIRRAVEAAPRANLSEVAKVLWSAFAAGHVTEAEAESLTALIEARKAIGAPPAAVRRSVGSRPRSSASLERRRRWAASGLLPGHLATRFTTSEVGVLSVIATEVAKRGDCRWTIGHIAAVTGVSETTVKRTIREARAQGLITVEERRLSTWRNAPNVVRIVAPEWVAWLRLSGRKGGGQSAPPTNNKDSRRASGSQSQPVPGRKSGVPFKPKASTHFRKAGIRADEVSALHCIVS